MLAFALLALAPVPSTAPTPEDTDVPASFALPADEAARLGPAANDPEATRFVPGEGLKLRSEDDRFALRLGLRLGFLYSVKNEADAAAVQHALEIRRLRVLLSGHLFGPKNTYLLQLGFAPRELELREGRVRASPVQDAYLQFEQLRDLNLRIGTYQVRYTRERNLDDVNPLLIDRSLSNDEFNLDRDLGLDFRSEDLGGVKKLHYYAGVFLGEGRELPGFGEPAFLYVGRVDVLPLGLFEDYEASDLWRFKKLRLSFGAAYAFHDRARRDKGVLGTRFADGGTTNYHNATADVVLKYAGWTVDLAYMWRHGRRNPGDAVNELGVPYAVTPARNGHGWLAQTALLIPRTRLEPAIRYSGARGLGVTSMPDRDELGGGLNYYFYGHNLKLQVDYFHSFDPTGITASGDLFRLQIQAGL